MTTNRTERLLAQLRTSPGGSPSEIAERLEVHRTDSSFRDALARAVAEGYFAIEGETRNRTYRRIARLRVARACPVCQTRVFGDPTWICPQCGRAEDQVNRPYVAA